MRSAACLCSLPTALLLLLSAPSLVTSEVITKPSGLKIEDTKIVKCDRPSKTGDTISVHYRGTLEDGLQFDESWDRGQPFEFKLGAREVITGWDQGLVDMCVGTRRTLIIPPELGYGVRGAGLIPSNAVLIFETQLMSIKGVPNPPPPSHNEGQDTGNQKDAKPEGDAGEIKDQAPPDKSEGHPEGPGAAQDSEHEENSGECRLLGPFALVVQGALGVLALLSLVFKRWRERPRRPVKIWFFDASKQVVGTALLHVANLAMSMLSTADINAANKASQVAEQAKGEGEKMPNPCSFYLLNLAIDTTIGIPILVLLLRLLHAAFLRTPLANPPESLKTGYYGQPPQVSWWVKQSFIYFLGLFGMKLFVLFLFTALPWLPWIGDWALRWTEGNESLQIAFVMFIFPLAMNGLQYYIIDAFIMDKDGQEGYESVETDDGGHGEESEDRRPLRHGEGDAEDDEDKDLVIGRPRISTEGEETEPLAKGKDLRVDT